MEFTWFAMDCNVFTNPKVLRFAAALKLDADAAVGKLGRLWAWAMLTGNEDGFIGFLPDEEIADIMRWKKKPALLTAALTECGLLEDGADGKVLHGWMELNGNFQSKKRRERERKTRGISAEFPRNFPADSAPTVPDLTVPDPFPSPSSKGKERARRAAPRFQKPTVEEIADYCLERGNHVDAQRFFDFYEAKGWRVGKNDMRDWKACVRTWEQRDGDRKPEQGGNVFAALALELEGEA